jgi:hypothetical protein
MRLAYLTLPLTLALLAVTSGCRHKHACCGGCVIPCCSPCACSCYAPPLEDLAPPLAAPPPPLAAPQTPQLGSH